MTIFEIVVLKFLPFANEKREKTINKFIVERVERITSSTQKLQSTKMQIKRNCNFPSRHAEAVVFVC